MTTINITSLPCPKCGETKNFDGLDEEKFRAWQHRGMYIQDAFPHLNADDRERFITGFCPPCWTKTFSEKE